MKRRAVYLTGAALSFAIASCATAPELPPAPENFASAQALANNAALAADPAPAWVDSFGVEELVGLVREARGANPDLMAAEARSDAARYRARGARGDLLPDLSVGIGRSRTETPVPGTDDRTRVDLTTSQVSSSWEVDVWGRLTARTLASYLTADALAADFDAARLSVAGQTARSWVNLVAAQQFLALAQEDLDTRNRALDLTQRRYERGLADSLALRTARSQSATARANFAAAEESLRNASRALQETLGRYPDATMRAGAQLPALGRLEAAGAPRDLLERRPDVVASEARMQAAGFRVHEARAALLPRLTLTATADGAGDELGDVADFDELVTNVIGGLTMPLFQGGRLRNEAYAASSEQREAAADYVRTAIGAWREVESAISNDRSLETRERETLSAVEEAREAQALAEREYGRGVATIFELIDAYTRRIDAERALIDVRAARVNNRIDYHVALGSGAAQSGLARTGEEASR